MNDDLKILKDSRVALLLAEVGALLHNVGKLGKAFIRMQIAKGGTKDLFGEYAYRYIVGIAAELAKNYEKTKSGKPERSSFVIGRQDASKNEKTKGFLSQFDKDWLKDTTFKFSNPLDDRIYRLGDFIEFQQFDWYRPDKKSFERTRKIVIPIEELFSKGSIATQLLEASHHAASGGEKEGSASRPQEALPIYSSTVFEHETPIPFDKLDDLRGQYFKCLQSYVEVLQQSNGASSMVLIKARKEMLQKVKPILIQMIADTQRPINDIMLWDILTSVAALHKAALAQALLQQNPQLSRDTLRWRLLSISVDGPAFVEQAHRVTDILGRRQVIQQALDEVRDLFEVVYPAGNEIYRDENGSIIILPDVIDRDGRDLLQLTDAIGIPLIDRIYQAFVLPTTGAGTDQKRLDGDLIPEVKVSRPYQGQAIKLAEVIKNRAPRNHPDLHRLEKWWQDPLPKKDRRDVCSVCGLRPQTYGVEAPGSYEYEKADKRKICSLCLTRRESRSKAWMTNEKHRARTIWIDEVADVHGYSALIACRFELSRWLEGTEIEKGGRSASFARTQRVWRTTKEFWQEISGSDGTKLPAETLIGTHLPTQVRIRIEPEDKPGLGHYHIYEAEWHGVRFNLVWSPVDGSFLTASNLDYFCRQLPSSLNIGNPASLSNKLERNREILLFEPSAYERPAEKKGTISVKSAKLSSMPGDLYKPFIPLLDSPDTFMALVPAERALGIARAIEAKYLCEMGRVQERLPLAVGLVYCQRRTPMRAVLNAGRRLLKMPLSSGSRFDFEFLDTSARRYEIHYGSNGGNRIGDKSYRPYQLAELETIDTTWRLLQNKLATSQIRALHSLIEAKRQAWDVCSEDETFQQFVWEVFANAEWRQSMPDPLDMSKLIRAATSGMLSDVVEIFLSISKEAEYEKS